MLQVVEAQDRRVRGDCRKILAQQPGRQIQIANHAVCGDQILPQIRRAVRVQKGAEREQQAAGAIVEARAQGVPERRLAVESLDCRRPDAGLTQLRPQRRE